MRSASSPGQVAIAVLCCIHLLYPCIRATDTAEISLKSANHKSGIADKVLAGKLKQNMRCYIDSHDRRKKRDNHSPET